ncbi:MAG: Serine/threonine-protein kinase PknB [Pelotomaculum sp. PtaB.Bin104]|nr:MAG: Serine/threonine-protein kinase PknB [Pelotomaculum sp. PtaB.Bin104]
MGLPAITETDVEIIIPGCKVVGDRCNGGQKVVFPCLINEKKYAIKFMLVNLDILAEDNPEITTGILDEITARALREVEIMRKCDSPYLIKLGPVELQRVSYNDQIIILFSEEWVEGEDLSRELARTNVLQIMDVIKLGIQITSAIQELWSHSKVHRDIKPGNILHCSNSGDFLLLDMGLAFDLSDKSLTAFGQIPCTRTYVSPEQLNIAKKRSMDFRSDLFNLGIVMYESITGEHPFYKIGMSDMDIFSNVISYDPPPPSSLRRGISNELNDLIIRLLGKNPHFRYRSCEQLIVALKRILENMGV